jgi:hypothetical protein
MAVSVLAVGPVYAGGAGGCDYGSQDRYTSAEPQEQSEAAKKLASLSVAIGEQQTAGQATESAPETAYVSTSPSVEKTSAQ